MNHPHCQPTVRGLIKQHRVCSYDIHACLHEFLDNALDAGATKVEVGLRERGHEDSHFPTIPHKILISDNVAAGISLENLQKIFSWTYERRRSGTDIGEYGVGFKAASVNLAEKLTVYTQTSGGKFYQAVIDWIEMSMENRWEPDITEITKERYEKFHPFSTGSSFVLENIRPESFSNSLERPTDDNHSSNISGISGNHHYLSIVLEKWLEETAYVYRFILYQKPELQISFRGNWETTSRNLRQHDLFTQSLDPCPPLLQRDDEKGSSITSLIRIYRDSQRILRVYYQSQLGSSSVGSSGNRPWYKIVVKRRFKNGNSQFEALTVPHGEFDSLQIIDTLIFRTAHEQEAIRSSELMSRYKTCSLDILRGDRVVARDLNLRNPESQKLGYFLKHELVYQDYSLNTVLGVQFNKKNSGRLPENDLRDTLEYTQKEHEKVCEVAERSRYLQQLQTIQTIQTIQKEGEKQDKMDKQDKTDGSVISVVSTILESPQPLLSQPPIPIQPQLLPAVGVRRKHFSEKTKIHILQKQECRDKVMDFVLNNTILPMEYDHVNGHPTNNSQDNCQAISVITHAIKTRHPECYEILEEGSEETKSRFIVELMNCITRSRYFREAFEKKRIRFHDSGSEEEEGSFFSWNP